MANEEHLRILKQGIETWNKWRIKNPNAVPNFYDADLYRLDLRSAQLGSADLRSASLRRAHVRGADLSNADLYRADLGRVDLSGADLSSSNCIRVDLRHADLSKAELGNARLRNSILFGANLDGADLSGADLRGTVLIKANLNNSDLSNATLSETVFSDVDLSKARGLENCKHYGPSIIDQQSLERSKDLPLIFLRGCGLSDQLIDYLPSIVGRAINYYSCFISYSSKDEEFAERLHADLQDNGVRCWFAPHDLPIGRKILDGLDEAIRLRDKVILILSDSAIGSDWVEDEVNTAFEEERERGETMLFPIRLDGAVMETSNAWASKLRARNIGDFTKWKEHDAYRASLERVLRDLRAER